MATLEPLHGMAEPWDDRDPTQSRAFVPAVATPIVPRGSIAGRSLAAVVAIMTFLGGLTAGTVMMVVSAATDWQSEVAREVTIQVRPAAGHDMEADVRAATELTRKAAGVAEVRAFSQEESAKLVEPWLGSGLALNELPIPRMIVVKLLPGAAPDFSALRKSLAAQLPNASLDDHRGWIARLRTLAETAVVGGLAILALVLAVTVLSVTFATRGAMATNRPIVEVLHYVGATDNFIASQFQRHFLMLGLRGGAIGGGGAIALFGFLEAANVWLTSVPGGDELIALFGGLSIGISGYVVILAQIVLVAAVTALASRQTVNRTLASIG